MPGPDHDHGQAVMERIGMRRDGKGAFDHPSLPEGDPLRSHVLHRIGARRVAS